MLTLVYVLERSTQISLAEMPKRFKSPVNVVGRNYKITTKRIRNFKINKDLIIILIGSSDFE